MHFFGIGSLDWLMFGLAWLSLGYLACALSCVWRYRERPHECIQSEPPVSVLKPLNGLDVQLYANLSSFCAQHYPTFQIVFAVASHDDPALPIVARVVREYPDLDLALVVDSRTLGTNYKISNVANAYRLAKYDIVVIADSDMRVEPDYLSRIAAAFAAPNTGAVTCLYTGSSGAGFASTLASMFINESFLPSVLVALRLQALNFCFGATMAVRRDVLRRIGGFEALASQLADDYLLGKLVSALGCEVRLASCVAKNWVYESDLRALWHHEIRWARTVRTVRPISYVFSVITQALPLTAIAWLLSNSTYAALLLSAALALRVILNLAIRTRFRIPGRATWWLIPVRDMLSFAVWAASFLGREVRWQGNTFAVRADGQLRGIDAPEIG